MFIKRILIGYFHVCGEYKERGYIEIASYLFNRINVARISIINIFASQRLVFEESVRILLMTKYYKMTTTITKIIIKIYLF